jgi:hypothetical protein
MALIACHECGNQVSSSVKACPKCGANGKALTGTPAETSASHRKVSVLLIIGIALMPYIFAWLLLRKGYSRQSRVIALGWMTAFVMAAGLGHSLGDGNGQPAATKPTIDIDPDRAAKDMTAALARQAVPSALKDPSSAEFGDVWGMSAKVACGYINGKNSFGAMAGKTRFIYDGGRVLFQENGTPFARTWNKLCIAKPEISFPTSVAGMRWGARPTSALKPYMPPTDEGLALYVPAGKPEPLEGIPVAEADFSFDHKHLFAADFYIDGEAGRDAVLRKFVDKYGTPQQYDEGAETYSWKWPHHGGSITVSYDESHRRTTINFSRGGDK